MSPPKVYKVSGIIWRMEIDVFGDILCLEVRDTIKKTTTFYSVDLNNGNTYLENLNTSLGWDCGLAAAAHGVILINGYQTEVFPVCKGLIAIDSKTGEELWANYNFNLENIHPLGFEVFDGRMQPKHITLVDSRSGTAIIPRFLKETFFQPEVIYPRQVNSTSINYPNTLPTPVDDGVLFLEHNEYRILSLHALKEGLLTQQLFVYNSSGDTIFEDIIASDIQKLQPEAFIVYKNKLIWLQNRSVLKVSDL